jgi:NAD+ synthase (glutamine-hydrolysing)
MIGGTGGSCLQLDLQMPAFSLSLYDHGFVRVAACTPRVRIADPAFNLQQTMALAKRASDAHCILAVFPELGLSGYSNEDLFFQDALLAAVSEALEAISEASRELCPMLVVGAPLRVEHRLLNCAVVIYRGQVLAISPKTYLPNYREFYEKRQFSSARDVLLPQIQLCGTDVPLGNDIVLQTPDVAGFGLHVEVCEDLWVPLSPSSYAALAGATLLVNLSASNATIGKSDYRQLLCASQSGRCVAAYVYSAAGFGESTTDLAWDGHALIYENSQLLAESSRFPTTPAMTIADIDLDRLMQERARLTSFNDNVRAHAAALRQLRRVWFPLEVPRAPVALERHINRFPFVPPDAHDLDDRCSDAFSIQVQGLAQRLLAADVHRIVLGLSGGLDSTHAALIATQAFDLLGWPRGDILGYTLPGFATSEQSLAHARQLMSALRISAAEIDIRPAAQRMLESIGHPAAHGEAVYDATFENVQAGERASTLFRLANRHAALVLGTSDLSETALGYTTYGIGDHMSHYAVNASVPKTLIQHLIRWVISRRSLEPAASRLLEEILAARFSPELVPQTDGQSQTAEATVGPYELQDFNLYHLSRYGYRPSKVLFLAHHAWSDASRGTWPSAIPQQQRREYDLATLRRWLEVFIVRFFQTSQFKRSALPNGPKIGSGGALSPRSDWRAPSDATAAVWLDELAQGSRR